LHVIVNLTNIQHDDDRPTQPSHTAYDDDHEGVYEDLDSHLGLQAAHRAREHSGQSGHADADPEDEQPDSVEIDAQRAHHQRVPRAGADDEPDAGLLEEEPERH